MPSVPQAPRASAATIAAVRARRGRTAAASYFSAPWPRRRPISSASAMALAPTAVTIVTATGPEGPAGATANAVTSLSLDPPLMLACLDRGSRTLEIVRASGAFGVSVLGAGQEALARGVRQQGAAHGEVPRGRLRPSATGCRSSTARSPGSPARCASSTPAATTRSRSARCSRVGADGGDPLVFFGGAYRPLD